MWEYSRSWSLDLSTLTCTLLPAMFMVLIPPRQWWLVISLLRPELQAGMVNSPLNTHWCLLDSRHLTCSKPQLCQICSSHRVPQLSKQHHHSFTHTPYSVSKTCGSTFKLEPKFHYLLHLQSNPSSLQPSNCTLCLLPCLPL